MQLSGVPWAVCPEVVAVLELGSAPEAVHVPHPQVLRQHVQLLVGLELALLLLLLFALADGAMFFCTFIVDCR